MSLHRVMREITADLTDDQLLLLTDLLTEAKDNEAGELFLQVDEDGKADIDALAALSLADGSPVFASVSIEPQEELLDTQLTLSAAARKML